MVGLGGEDLEPRHLVGAADRRVERGLVRLLVGRRRSLYRAAQHQAAISPRRQFLIIHPFPFSLQLFGRPFPEPCQDPFGRLRPMVDPGMGVRRRRRVARRAAARRSSAAARRPARASPPIRDGRRDRRRRRRRSGCISSISSSTGRPLPPWLQSTRWRMSNASNCAIRLARYWSPILVRMTMSASRRSPRSASSGAGDEILAVHLACRRTGRATARPARAATGSPFASQQRAAKPGASSGR